MSRRKEAVIMTMDRPATHGMLVVGEETVFLSHLPMLNMSTHAFQVILEVTLEKEGSAQSVQTIYADDRKKHPDVRIYTFEPEKFSLPDLAPSGPSNAPRKTSFRGRVVRGHFERGGDTIPGLEDVVAKVVNVIHFRRFDPRAGELPQLEYLLFGKGGERFISHLITKGPDFDQTLSAQVLGHEFTDEALRRGVRVVFPGRANTASKKIREQEQVAGEVPAAGNNPATAIEVRAGVEFYFDIEDLNM
jgi:hypothetical protein